ncbi:MAG TPA: GNAT family N-acetyltransferase [Candidatus Limnocylindrales bacterium]|nr:GNAT family N-acetyltransferase [Candidatus Limnocylindrales bacterium]
MPFTIRPVTSDELLAWYESLASTFFIWGYDPEASASRPSALEHLDRRIGAFDGDRIVGTYRTFGTELTMPGGRTIPVSAVSAVSTRSTDRRRGVLSELVEDDIARGVARGDVASVLLAAEWPIYGRYGYGPATWQGRWTLRTRAASFRTEPSGSMEILNAAAARPIVEALYDRYRVRQPGEIRRPVSYWDQDLGIAPPPGKSKWKGVVAVHHDDAGAVDGFVRYSGEEHWDDGIPDNVAVLEDLFATSTAAEVELWRFLSSLDLVATVRVRKARTSEPFAWYLEDARAMQLAQMEEALWVRPYDVPRLLASRAYDREADLVVEIDDRVNGTTGPAAGRFRLEAGPDGSSCDSTTKPAEVTISAAALGAAILGGSRLVDATRAGGAAEARPGALLELDRLLRTDDVPYCSTQF